VTSALDLGPDPNLPRVLVADPPWSFDDKLPGPGRGAAKHYACMSLREVANFEIPRMHPDSYLFLWRVASQVAEAYTVVAAWGFTPKSEIVWLKETKTGKIAFGMGHHVRASHESCILAVRGSPKPRNRSVRSVFSAPVGEHSEKPEAFFDLVEALCAGPFVELFARRRRDGWDCRGAECP